MRTILQLCPVLGPLVCWKLASIAHHSKWTDTEAHITEEL